MNLLEKIRWNIQYHLRRLRIAVLGHEVTCSRCGRLLTKAIVQVRDGKILLEGLEYEGIYVDFTGRDTVAFRHTDQSDCRPVADTARPGIENP